MSKAAIVTGASSGIGLAISRVLCEKGMKSTDLDGILQKNRQGNL